MTPLIFILAGEQSGDLIGGRLMAALKDLTQGNVKFVGVGGVDMAAQGLRSLFPMSDLSLMGYFEIIKHLPLLLKRLRQAKTAISQFKPDVIVTIDSPEFSLRLGKHGIPHIHYIAPTVWAWRAGRAATLAKEIDHLLAVYPFEPPYFEKHGLLCTFVGHMLTEIGIADIPHQLHSSKTICWLPGSRLSEVKALLPIHKQALIELHKKYPNMAVTLPVAPGVAEYVKSQVQDLPFKLTITTDRYTAMRSADVALAASGTVNLELALAQTPFVITYKLNPLTAWLAKRLLKVKYVTMVNILCDALVVPELLQENCTAEKVCEQVDKLLTDARAVEQQLLGLRKAAAMLQNSADKSSYAAAKVVLGYCKTGNKHRI